MKAWRLPMQRQPHPRSTVSFPKRRRRLFQWLPSRYMRIATMAPAPPPQVWPTIVHFIVVVGW